MKVSRKVKKRVFIISGITLILLSLIVTLGRIYQLTLLGTISDIIIYPFQKIINIANTHVGGLTGYLKDIDTLINQNEELLQENENLLYQNTMLTELGQENENLKSLLDLAQRYEQYPSQGANIIGKEPGNWYKVFTIDKGKIAGLDNNDIILANGGLAGKIIEVNPLSSKVITLIDDRSYVSIKVVRSGDIGVLMGDIDLSNKGIAKVELDINAEIVKGDQVITSHLSDIYPPGIPIGTVEEVIVADNGLIQYAYIKPFVDFNNLQNVLIISKNGVEK
ncbi:rod shape-determining protein MreC [Candidatus Epulonipiscium fishelsonii]|uniref:Rod shape-determining protein MreC n=1 Tax=Candidatus Epulonipiscium fishelsonii TaxID=77094 RepID=A0ACC8XE91_9FIRM|nr:rod shape-determining protein MreC [Epulopiscium sp. SCG-B05WGA-EpuloA1]ONI41234.1 rod shape-determining protein MreC [Epulopiscium sp. SCG-B11WGA-EpuloA1]